MTSTNNNLPPALEELGRGVSEANDQNAPKNAPNGSAGLQQTSQPELPRTDNEMTPKRIGFEEGKSHSMPNAVGRAKSDERRPQSMSPTPFSSNARQSIQLPVGGGPRPSEEFDRRLDGPFGQPRKSSVGRRPSQATTLGSPRPSNFGSPIRDPTPEAQGPELNTPEEPIFMPEPPPLNYTLRTRKLSIFLWWTVIVFDSTVMPIALYFGLWYGVGPGSNTPTERKQKLSANAVFSIVTAAIGGASILEYFLRFWRLYKKTSDCRVIGAHRWYLDWFHWNFTVAWLIIMVELIVGSVPDDPYIRLLSVPLATMLFVFGTELLIVDIMRYFRVPAPCRISSVPKGAQLRPGIYSLVEDICAVDGSGGTDFREALNRRYEASHVFRTMLRRLGVFWAVGAEGMAVMCTALIFTLEKDYAYTIGWSVPFIWAGVWTLFTFWYVKRELKRERKVWAETVQGKHRV